MNFGEFLNRFQSSLTNNHLGKGLYTNLGERVMNEYVVPEGYREAAGCIVMRQTDECILLLRRSELETSWHGMYELPGGKLEDGETPEDTARIETKEEAGVEVEIVRRIPSHVDHELKKVYHMFLAHLPEGAEIQISEEHDDIKWTYLEEAVTLHHPNDVSEALNSLSHHARFGIKHLIQELRMQGLPCVCLSKIS